MVVYWHMVGNRFLTLLSNMFTKLESHRYGDLLQSFQTRTPGCHYPRGELIRY